jgi:SAM-dependent methyltransferase
VAPVTRNAQEPAGATQREEDASSVAEAPSVAASEPVRSAGPALEAAAGLYALVKGFYGKSYNDGGCQTGEGYAGAGHWENESRWERAARGILAFCASEGHELGRTLDLGCGRGTLVSFLRRSGADVFGLDVSDLRLARTVAGNALALPFVDGAFRTIVALDIIEHVPWNWQRFLWAELRRTGAERIVVTVPTELPHYRYGSDVGLRNHYLCATPPNWRALFEHHGYDVVREGVDMEDYGPPFAFGETNYPFFLARRSA